MVWQHTETVFCLFLRQDIVLSWNCPPLPFCHIPFSIAQRKEKLLWLLLHSSHGVLRFTEAGWKTMALLTLHWQPCVSDFLLLDRQGGNCLASSGTAADNDALLSQGWHDKALHALKTLTSLNEEARPFCLSNNSIWSYPSVSSLSDYHIWRSWRRF